MGTFQHRIKTKVYLYVTSLIEKSKDGCINIDYSQHCENIELSQWDLEKVLCELDHDGSIKLSRHKTGAVIELTLSHNIPDRCK